MSKRPIENFDSLLRDLASYELVTKDPEPGQGWHLSEAAQARLTELHDLRRATVKPENLVYLDHSCAVCQSRGLTRLRDGAYLCDACAAQGAQAEVAGGSDERVTNVG
jgi:ribosomal protein L37AE/L43A